MKYSSIIISLFAAVAAEAGCNHDEAKNKYGSNRCTTAFECQGIRYCVKSLFHPTIGYCEGKSGCDCNINEANNTFGANRCWKDSECNGRRFCSWGFCQGDSGCGTDDTDIVQEWGNMKEDAHFIYKKHCVEVRSLHDNESWPMVEAKLKEHDVKIHAGKCDRHVWKYDAEEDFPWKGHNM